MKSRYYILIGLLSMVMFPSGYSAAGCGGLQCPVMKSSPAPVCCSDDTCNTHIFFTDQAGRLLDLEHYLVDQGWPCPGTCPQWDETTHTYIRNFTDMGWKLGMVSSETDCNRFSETPVYQADESVRRVAAVSVSGNLMIWSSPAQCCRHCAGPGNGCNCTLSPAENACDPPVCSCDCPEPGPCESWEINPGCSCNDMPSGDGCCWQGADLTALSGIHAQGVPAMSSPNIIYVRSLNNHLYQFWWRDGGWAWADLTEAVMETHHEIANDPACYHTVDNTTFLVFTDTNSHLIGMVWNMGKWYCYDLTEYANGAVVSGRPSIYFNATTQTGFIFVRGADNALLEWWWNSCDGLQFVNITTLCNQKIAGNPVICRGDRGLSLIFRNMDNHLIRILNNCIDYTRWTCTDLTEIGCGKIIAGDPACLCCGSEDSIFARTPDGRLLNWIRRGDGSWLVTDLFMNLGCPNDLGMNFSFIAAGTFDMGSSIQEYGHKADEGPVHQVTITDHYYMQTTEITQAQWTAVMGYNPSFYSGCPSCPVENITWLEAKEFVTQMNARCEGLYGLPTEAEWEYAARTATDTCWSFGNNAFDLSHYAWFSENAFDTTHPVALKWANSWGLYDIYGNVWEWVGDAYANYPAEAQVNPFSLDSSWVHIIRGGSWNDPDTRTRSASRGYDFYSDDRQPFIGMRLKRISP